MSPVGRSWRAITLLVLVSLAGCVDTGDGPATGTTAPPPSSSTYEPAAGRVVVVGDSLTVGAEENLRKLADLHGFALDLSARNGRQIPAGVEELGRLDAAGADLVVVALGTNDAAQPDFDRAAADTLIDQAMAVTGDAPVLWMNVYRDPGTPAGDAAEVFDEALVDAQARHPNLTALDWAAYVEDHPEIVDADRVHHTWEGYVARSRWMRDQIVSRLRGGTAPAPVPPATTG